MKSLLQVIAASAAIVLFTGCGGSGSALIGNGSTTSTTVTAAGGAIQPNSSVSMVFAPNAVAASTTITVQSLGAPALAPNGLLVAPDTAYQFGPAGVTFAAPVQVSIVYDPSTLEANTNQSTLALYTLVNGAWTQTGITFSTVNTTTDTVTAGITTLGAYCILGVDPNLPASIHPL